MASDYSTAVAVSYPGPSGSRLSNL